MGTYYAGKGGSFVHGNTTYPAKSWSLDVENGLVEVTNQTSSGWKEFIPNISGATFSMEMPFDPTLQQLSQGQALTNLQLGINSSYKVTIATGYVRKIRPSTSVDGAAMLSVEGVASGTVNTTFA